MNSPVGGRRELLVSALTAAVGPDQVLIDPDLMAGYITDVIGRGPGKATAVVRPGNIAEVSAVLKACQEFGFPVVPQGGNTGLVGGSIPHDGEVLMSLRRLNAVGDVDVAASEVTVGAGVTIAALQQHARRAGLAYGVDLASRDSATVGGTIATNAGGLGMVAHGDTRRQVIGLQVAFADGTVGGRLSGTAKQSVGPDVVHLLVGSEGSLGVITAARMQLVAAPDVDRFVTLVAVENLAQGLSLMMPGISAIEFFDRRCLELVVTHRPLGRPLPGDPPFYVLMESVGPPNLPDEAVAVVDRRLWSYREAIPDVINSLGVSCKLDVGIPSGRLDEFVAVLDRLGLEGDRYLFGHLAEGNFHVNVIGAADPNRVADQVFDAVVSLGGSIASEHGIGVDKALWWRQTADPSMLAQSRRIKEALDPANILNPKVFWG